MNAKTVLFSCAIALSLLFFSCDNQIGKKPAPKPVPQVKNNATPKPQQPQTAKPAQQPKPAPQQAQKPASKPSMMDDVNSVINYGTGATAINAKRKMTEKLNKAQHQHDKQLNDALK